MQRWNGSIGRPDTFGNAMCKLLALRTFADQLHSSTKTKIIIVNANARIDTSTVIPCTELLDVGLVVYKVVVQTAMWRGAFLGATLATFMVVA